MGCFPSGLFLVWLDRIMPCLNGLDISRSYMGWDSISTLLHQKRGISSDSCSSTQVFEIENCARTSAEDGLAVSETTEQNRLLDLP